MQIYDLCETALLQMFIFFFFFNSLELSYESEYSAQHLFGICIRDRNPLSGHFTAPSFMEVDDKANLELRTR